MYPKLTIALDKIEDNARTLLKICSDMGIEICAVNKVNAGSKIIAKRLVSAGIKSIGDSRVENLKEIADLPVDKVMIRVPMQSEVDEVVKYADISLNSSLDTIKALANAARNLNRVHRIILMLETGDLREGIYDFGEALEIINAINGIDGVELEGIGTNLTCFGGVKPSKEHMDKLANFCLENNIKPKLISGGNSSSLSILNQKDWVKGINHLRIGTSIMFGVVEIEGNRLIPGMTDDAFILEAEIVELSNKPSVPYGEICIDAFGNVPTFEDEGMISRAILAIGKQDTELSYLSPIDKGIEIMGGSSDYILVNIGGSSKTYSVGDVVSFKVGYVALLRMMTSKYVRKVFMEGDLCVYD